MIGCVCLFVRDDRCNFSKIKSPIFVKFDKDVQHLLTSQRSGSKFKLNAQIIAVLEFFRCKSSAML